MHKVLQAQRDSSVLNALQALEKGRLTPSWTSQVDKLGFVEELAIEQGVHVYA